MKRVGWFVACYLLIGAQAFAASPGMLRAIDNQKWGTALQSSGGDRYWNLYISWRQLLDHAYEPTFDQLQQFITRHPHWPSQNVLRIRAERALFGLSDDALAKSWLKEYPPISGYGKMALAATLPKGSAEQKKLVQEAWFHGDFTKFDEGLIMARHRALLSPADHQARTERLLNMDLISAAERMLPLLPSGAQRVAQARMALIRDAKDVNYKVSQVPASLQNDTGLSCDRIVWRMKENMPDGAAELLKRLPANATCANKVWRVRVELARDAIEARNYKEAQALLANPGVLESYPLSEILFLRGWMHLVFLNQPSPAYADFRKLYKEVTYPVSKSRGAYWSGRAADALGKPADAKEWYRKGAEFMTTFYGQLAYAKLNPGKPLLFPGEPTPKDRQGLVNSEVMEVVRRLVGAGRLDLASPLVGNLADNATSSEQAAAISQAALATGAPYLSVKASKQALQKNIILPKSGWPTVTIPPSNLEPAFPHAIARQESEFNTKAVSPADARGLMQVLPSTARKVASEMGLSHNDARLFEPQHNMQIGSRYLSDLVDGFSGSYILAIAGYNAGPGKSREWTARFGRPGGDLNQTLNWIESIPYGETRNYVMRVLENVQVYRARMQPEKPLGLVDDLKR